MAKDLSLNDVLVAMNWFADSDDDCRATMKSAYEQDIADGTASPDELLQRAKRALQASE